MMQRALRVLILTTLVLTMIPVAPVALGASTTDYPVCDADYAQSAPRIDGDRVVWVDERNRPLGGSWNSDVYLYDFATGIESQLTTSTLEQSWAEISGDWVVYWESDGTYGNSAIKALNVSTDETVDVWVGNSGWAQRPRIDGDIVVWEYSATVGPSDFDVLGYDLDARTGFTVADGGGDQRFPAIGGGKVIYEDGGWWSYDIATTAVTELTNLPGGVSVTCTDADDQHWAFIATPDSTPYLYVMDLATSDVETLTTSYAPYAGGDEHVDIDGDLITYSAEPPGPYFKSFVYSLSAGTDRPVSSFDSDQYQAHVSDGTIVWRDMRNYPGSGENYYDIYTDRMIDLGPAPTSTISGVPTGWTRTYPVELSIEASPSAGASIFYSLNGGSFDPYSGGISIDSDGVWDVAWYAQSAAGRETTRSATVRLDHVAPDTGHNASKSAYTGSATITLDPSDSVSGVASTRWRLDGGVWRSGVTVKCTTVGTHTLQFYSIDVAGNVETEDSVIFTVNASPARATTPVEGADRYKTAVDASVEAFPDGIEGADYEGYRTAVVATGNNWPDALGAASLAGALGGPILLTDAKALPSAVSAEIGRLKADRVIIVGGVSAVTDAVRSAIDALPGVSVERIAGANRYETARKVAARAVDAQGAAYDGTAIITTGDNFPDALAGSPIAAHTGWPIYLMGEAIFDSATADQMDDDGVTHVYLLGGTSALPTFVENTIKARTGIVVGPTDRIAGDNRYQTAARVAQLGVDHAGLAWDGVALATGEVFPDALAGGVMQGHLGSVVLLTTSKTLHAEPAAKLSANKSVIDELRYLGGTSALAQSVRDKAWQLIQ